MDALGKILHANFLGYSHWFMSIGISQTNNYSISVGQDRYATSINEKYLDTSTVKEITTFYKTTLPSDVIIAKADESTNDKKVEKLTREFNIHYRACIGSLIFCYLKEWI